MNLGAPIAIPASLVDRFDGSSVIATGAVAPRNALHGTPLHKVDLRVQEQIKLAGKVRLTLLGEVFNVFNHANYGSFVTIINNSTFAQPRQSLSNAYVPRSGQLGFRLVVLICAADSSSLLGGMALAAATAIGRAHRRRRASMRRCSHAIPLRLIGPSAPSGRVWSVTGVPGQPKTFYACTAEGGVWRTTNNGTTMTQIFDRRTPRLRRRRRRAVGSEHHLGRLGRAGRAAVSRARATASTSRSTAARPGSTSVSRRRRRSRPS